MKLLALILGFALEHMATQLLHLRELRWFDHYFDSGLRMFRNLPRPGIYPLVIGLVLLPVVPVIIVRLLLGEADIRWDVGYVVFSLLILFLSLGPRDLETEVNEYCEALEAGRQEQARDVIVELAELRRHGATDAEIIERAIFIQAPGRIFGVVFWFFLLGPVGAWLFRVSDLCRRRTALEAVNDSLLARQVLPVVENLHGLLVWMPVRLAALGYALGGSFDEALSAWRHEHFQTGRSLQERNEQLAADVGHAAMAGALQQPENSALAARNAIRLVNRTLFIWLFVIAMMTLFGWAV